MLSVHSCLLRSVLRMPGYKYRTVVESTTSGGITKSYLTFITGKGNFASE